MLETDARRGDTVVLDVWEDVLMVRMSGSQLGSVGMFKRIVPGKFFAAPINLVTVVENSAGVEIKELPHVQDDVAREGHPPFEFGQGGTDGGQDQR